MIHVHGEGLSVDVPGNPLSPDVATVTLPFPVTFICRDLRDDEAISGKNIQQLTIATESSSHPSNVLETGSQHPTPIPASCNVTLPTPAQHQSGRTKADECSNDPCVEWATEAYDCQWNDCRQGFASVDSLVMHINSEHVHVERPDVDYRCQWRGCVRQGKGFNARYKMLIHLRTHTQERPHKCPICYKCFSRVENLKIHNRSHTGERPYPCPYEGCNKAYSNSSDRFKHIKTHQEQRPFICKQPGCDKRYTDPSSLRKHVRIHGHYFRNEGVSAKGKSYQSFVPTHIGSSDDFENKSDVTLHVDSSLSSSDSDLLTRTQSTGTLSNEVATCMLPVSNELSTVIIPLSSTSTPTSIEFSSDTTAMFTVPQSILHFSGQGSISCFQYSGLSTSVNNHISGCSTENINILPSTPLNLPLVLSATTQCRSTQTEVSTEVAGATSTMLSCLPSTDLALRSEAMFATPILSDDEVSSENIIQTSSENQESGGDEHPLDLSTSPISRHPPISLNSLHGDDLGGSCENSFSSSIGENGKWELPNLNPD